MKRIFALGVLLISGMSLAQVQNPDFDKEVSDSEIDSANWSQHTIVLQDVNAYSLKFNKDIEKKYYIWLERRVDDIYPFLQKAVTEYYLVKDSADQISSKRERRRYIKKTLQRVGRPIRREIKTAFDFSRTNFVQTD